MSDGFSIALGVATGLLVVVTVVWLAIKPSLAPRERSRLPPPSGEEDKSFYNANTRLD